ncbi:hypothetical protein DRP53_00745 [candidate division WOR-3 bacterium]|uniref:Clan AA aspartic protease n=1 Tax=candidate division WOR-3 bacterium TaxID=2052148 RepID=A0A660SLC5_UNCW3|nr:MAG: hypothetical protein DRP53_00745 [candidate division WOR-3 bacterium]
MAVRVKILIEFGHKAIETVAIANTGYETEEPEVLLPEQLGRSEWGEMFNSLKSIEYKTFKGVLPFKALGEATIRVKAGDRESKPIKAKLLVSGFDREVLLNDKAIGALGISLIRVDIGRWRFTDDPPDKERDSELPERW